MSYLWVVDEACESAKRFASLDKAFVQSGEIVSKDSISEVVKCHQADTVYYIKRYKQPGKSVWRQWIGPSRCHTEWENLLFCEKVGVCVPKIIAYGEQTAFGQFKPGRSALITAEVKAANDLRAIASKNKMLFDNCQWRTNVANKIAESLAMLHQLKFVHGDLNWRNILVGDDIDRPKVCFFDMPIGGKKNVFILNRFIIKDLAKLDRLAKQYLSRSFRLRFYRHYRGIVRLTKADKKHIKKILTYYS